MKNLTDRKVLCKIPYEGGGGMEKKELSYVERRGIKKKKGVRSEVVAGVIYLLCVGASLLPVGIMKVANMYNPLIAFSSYLFAAFSLILFLLEFLLFFLEDDDYEREEVEVDMRLVLRFYTPMLLMLIPTMFLINSSDLKEGKALTVVGLYALYSLVLFATLVLIQVGYLVRSRDMVIATTVLIGLLNVNPFFYMAITQVANTLIIVLALVSFVLAVYVMLNRLL
jgi:hypothetical protein